MKLKNLTDCHTHSKFSPDAKDLPEKMIERAAELGISAYAITDHCDCNFRYSAEYYAKDISKLKDLEMYGSEDYISQSFESQKKLKEQYGDRLNFLIGVELGQPLQDIEFAEKIISNNEIDFIIGSHHQNKGADDFYYLEYDKMDLNQIYDLLDDYFSEMLDMCRWGKFDVLGHLTYPLRYIRGEYGIEIDMSRYDVAVREILVTLAQKGKGIEINTSGLRQKYGKTFPDFEYIKLFRTLGGEIITLGSDAHCAEDIGKGIYLGAEQAKSAGFEYISYFKKREPKFIKLK